jgi:hypothetical protein
MPTPMGALPHHNPQPEGLVKIDFKSSPPYCPFSLAVNPIESYLVALRSLEGPTLMRVGPVHRQQSTENFAPMIDVKAITELHLTAVERWHHGPLDNPYSDFLKLVCQQHQYNFLLWHEEDKARSPEATDAEIAAVKRRIDQLNQQRNDAIEKLDDDLIEKMETWGVRPRPRAKLNTETPGSVIDRLSILALRIYHMEEQANRIDADATHQARCADKLAILREQHKDLSRALAELVADLGAGRKRLKVYRQFKMYNDPTTNPYLYNAAQKPAA